jgi:hypothetical protein
MDFFPDDDCFFSPVIVGDSNRIRHPAAGIMQHFGDSLLECVAVQKNAGAFKIEWHQKAAVVAGEIFKYLAFLLIAGNNNFTAVCQSKMSSDFKQGNIADSWSWGVIEVIAQFPGEIFICQQAAAGGAGIITNTFFSGQRYLDLSRTAGYCQQFAPIDPSFEFRNRGIEMSG